MRRRLYFLLPDLASARQVMDDLLLARIEAHRVHVLAPRGFDLEDIPEASVLQKTDVVHGAQVGAMLGAGAGALGGILLVVFPRRVSACSWLPYCWDRCSAGYSAYG